MAKHSRRRARQHRTQLLPGRHGKIFLFLQPNVRCWYSEGRTKTQTDRQGKTHRGFLSFDNSSYFWGPAKHFVYMTAISGSGTHTQALHKVQCACVIGPQKCLISGYSRPWGLAWLPEQNIAKWFSLLCLQSGWIMCNYTMDHRHLTSEVAAQRQIGSLLWSLWRFVIVKKKVKTFLSCTL